MIRSNRSNPLDTAGRMPDVRAPLAIGLLAALALGAFGFHAHRKTVAQRAENVERLLAANGLGPAEATALNRGCGRGRSLYAWEAPSARGLACAGPQEAVELRDVSRPPRPSPPS